MDVSPRRARESGVYFLAVCGDGARPAATTAPGLVFDGRDDRHAGPQRAALGDVGGHADAHGKALDDLGEVAGGVVGRQQREHRARRRREARDHAVELLARQGVDRDRDRLPGLEAGELGLLEVGVDEDVGERHQRGDALAGLHVIADLGRAVADDAVDRRADLGERQIALGLGERGPQLRERRHGFLLLRLEHADIGDGVVERGLRAQHRRIGLVAVGDRLFERLLAGELLALERLLALVFELHPRPSGLRRGELRLRLRDGRALRLDLAVEARDGRRLGRDLVAGLVDGEAIVAVVDAGDEVAGMDPGVLLDGKLGDDSPRPWRRASCCWRAHRRRRSTPGSARWWRSRSRTRRRR